jgi:hypothetical protein
MSLSVIGTPSNMKIAGAPNAKLRVVESDVFNVCDRIKEIDPSLHVVLHEDHPEPWVVMEHCHDGVTRMVKRYAQLDPSILDDLRYMLHVPYTERARVVAAEVEAHNAELEKVDEEKMERMAFDMRRALRDANMADIVLPSHRPVVKRA